MSAELLAAGPLALSFVGEEAEKYAANPSISPLNLSCEQIDKIRALDKFESTIRQNPDQFKITECPLEHIFTPGLYLRKMIMEPFTTVKSKLHRSEHPFIVLKGVLSVSYGDGESIIHTAGHIGITKPGTCRALFAHTYVELLTIHATDKTNPEDVEFDIIEPHENPFLQLQ